MKVIFVIYYNKFKSKILIKIKSLYNKIKKQNKY